MSSQFEMLLLLLGATSAIKFGTSEHIDRRPLILSGDLLPQNWRHHNDSMAFQPIMVTIAPLFRPIGHRVLASRNYSVLYNDTDEVSHIREESGDGVIRLKHVARRQVQSGTTEQHRWGELEPPMKLNMSEYKTRGQVEQWPLSQQPFVRRLGMGPL